MKLKYPWEIADQLVSIPMRVINKEQLKLADLVLKPDVGGRKNTDFSNLRNLIDCGYKSAMENITIIQDSLTELYLNKISREETKVEGLVVKSDNSEVEAHFKFLESMKISEREIIYHLTQYSNLNYFSKFSAYLKKNGEVTDLHIHAAENETI
ncbi:MAG: hypothetical protein U5K00_08930 [Melioribacteraceae bacterium]|nr:hypothetical protein [Melioribacteraceae bacterium]